MLWSLAITAPPLSVAAPAWQAWPKVHSHSQVGVTLADAPGGSAPSSCICVLTAVNGPEPTWYLSVIWLVVIVSQPPDTLLVYVGTVKLRSSMSKVGSLRKLPLGEYSMRMTSGASTSKRASPSVTVAWVAAVPLAMSMLFDRLTGEVSVVAVCALAPVAAATTTISGGYHVRSRPWPRRGGDLAPDDGATTLWRLRTRRAPHTAERD